MAPRVILIGPPGAGKTTIGEVLSQNLGVNFADSDSMIEEEEKRSISEIFVDQGEKYFREIEKRIVLNAIRNADGVLALGGGAPLSEDVQSALKSAEVPGIYLEVSQATASPRLGFNRDRPLLLGNPRAQWNELLEVRRPIYEDVASKIVNVDQGTPSEISESIRREISGDKR
jgi:shikimate kinase